MPCFYDESPEEVQARDRAHYRHNSDVAEMLCHILSIEQARLGLRSVESEYGKAVGLWWAEHRERDALKARKAARERAREDARNKALNKLNKFERRALGLK